MYQETVEKQRAFFTTDVTRSYRFRMDQLGKLETGIRTYEPELYDALSEDLGKNKAEAYTTEIGFVLKSIRETRKKLKAWMKPRRAGNPLFLFGSRSFTVWEPYGVTLIISPFNYPVQLALEPLVAALSAGNTAIIKLSELTPHVSAVLSQLISTTFDAGLVTTVEGDAQATTELLKERFDYIFFTGSPRVGSLVMQAASLHLTPVTLELGGKSPAIVCADAPLAHAARSIAWGKFLNAGQTCVAPDYVLVDKMVKDEFIDEMKKAITEFYGDNPQLSPDYGRIVTTRHWQRLIHLMDGLQGKTVLGGNGIETDRYIAPTIVADASWDDAVMQEEIFGPILPIISYDGRRFSEDVIAEVRTHEKPLALYLFTQDKKIKDAVVQSLSFGGGVMNGTILHLTNSNLPFGGVGQSGMGSYHGIYGYRTFSHQKALIDVNRFLPLGIMYPPHSKGKQKLIKKLL